MRALVLLGSLGAARAYTGYAVGPDALSYQAAVSYCDGIGGEIASIHSDADNEAAREACGETTCWIGLRERKAVLQCTGFGKNASDYYRVLPRLERSFHATGTPVTPTGDDVASLCATGALSGAPVGQEPMGYLKIFDAVIYVGFFFSVITT